MQIWSLPDENLKNRQGYKQKKMFYGRRYFEYLVRFVTLYSFQMKKSDISRVSAQNIDCRYSLEPPRRSGSNEYPQSMFWTEIRKIMYTPENPSFTI